MGGLEYRRKLPHWIPDQTAIFLTWRLAGSLPRHPEILTIRKPTRSVVEYEEQLERDHSGPHWLADQRVATMVADAIRYGHAVRKIYSLYAWVIMPNHVHVVMEPSQRLPDITRWLKGRTGRSANQILGRTGIPFWQEESYDHWIRSADELNKTIRYVEGNPVRAGLVETAEAWRYSSAWGRWGETDH